MFQHCIKCSTLVGGEQVGCFLQTGQYKTYLFFCFEPCQLCMGEGGGHGGGEEKRTPNTPGCSVVILRTEHLDDRQELGV